MRPGFSDVPRLPRSPRIVHRISFPTTSNSVTLAIQAMSAQAVEISAPREYFGAARTIFSDPSRTCATVRMSAPNRRRIPGLTPA